MTQRQPAKVRIFNSVRIFLPITVILVACVITFPIVIFYKISHPPAPAEPTQPALYVLQSKDIEVSSGGTSGISGWWIPGEESSAAIVLAPGYGMCRSDALSLAAVLNKKGFNLFIYGQRGSSSSVEKASTFGLKEREDMLRVLEFIRNSGSTRIGIWGVDIGAYAALWAASSLPEVRAIAADCPYESILDFMEVRIKEEFNLDNRLLNFSCRQIFRLRYITSGVLKDRQIAIEPLSDRSVLCITGENRKALGHLSMVLYEKLPSKKEKVEFKNSRIRLMKGDSLREYDTRVAEFFQQNL